MPLQPQSFTGVDMTGSTFDTVRLSKSRFSVVRFDGSSFEVGSFRDIVMKKVDLVNVQITGDVLNVVINGVDVGPLITTELNRRDPERHLVYQEDRETASIEDYRAGLDVVERRWRETIDRVRAMPEGSEHASVDDEWTLVQTLRHISFATAAWFDRVTQGVENPYADTDLPWDEADDDIPRPMDRDAKVPLDDAVAQWNRRVASMREGLASLTDADLGRTVTLGGGVFPEVEDLELRWAVHTALTEAWEHHQFAERDLALLQEGS